jgi:hypothetical protein
MGIFMILLGIVGIIVNANGWFIVPSLAIKVCFIVGGFIIGVNLISIFRTQRMFTKGW